MADHIKHIIVLSVGKLKTGIYVEKKVSMDIGYFRMNWFSRDIKIWNNLWLIVYGDND